MTVEKRVRNIERNTTAAKRSVVVPSAGVLQPRSGSDNNNDDININSSVGVFSPGGEDNNKIAISAAAAAAKHTQFSSTKPTGH